jgi:ribosomal protein L37AE/L43A
MKATILCPACGELANYNSHFGAYFCTKCKWVDRSPGERRVARQALLGKFLDGEKMTRGDLKALLRTCEA